MYFFFSFFFCFFLSFFAFFFCFLDSFSDISESEEDLEELSESLELLLELEDLFSFFFSSFFATERIKSIKSLNQTMKKKKGKKLTFRFRDKFSTVEDFHFRIRPTVGIRFLVLHSLNNLLARNHLTKNYVDTKGKQKQINKPVIHMYQGKI